MGIQLEDGRGTGILQVVNNEGLARTLTVAGTLSGHASFDDGNVFSIIGTATVASGVVVPLFVQNNDPSLVLVLDRVLVQGVSIAGGTAIPNGTAVNGTGTNGAYFSLGYNRTFSALGTVLTPVTLNRTAVTVANVSAIGNNPTLVGTFLESHRWYIQANGQAFELIRPETDDIILGRTNTLEIRYSSDNTSGTVMALLKFIMRKADEMP